MFEFIKRHLISIRMDSLFRSVLEIGSVIDALILCSAARDGLTGNVSGPVQVCAIDLVPAD